MPFPAFWDSDRPLQPRGRSPDVTARAFPHPFARRLGIAWNRWARNLHEQDWRTGVNVDELLAEIKKWAVQIKRNLDIALGERTPQSGKQGQAPPPNKSHCATTLVHCMSGRGFLQNGPAKEDSINDML